MIKVIEIKTPNCSRCKQFEPEYQRIKSMYPYIEFLELIFGQNPEAMDYAKKYNIKAAPTFVIINDDREELAKPETLEEVLKSL